MFTEQFVHDNRRVKAFHNFLFEFPFAKNIVAKKIMLYDFYIVFVTNEPQVNLKNRLQIVEQIKCEMK